MAASRHPQYLRLRLSALGLATLLAALALPASAQDFVSSNRTVAGGNPMNGNYSGQSVFVGSSGFANGNFVPAPDVQVDIVAPAQFNFSDNTGGFFAVRSNSWVRMSGGNFGPASSFNSVGRMSLYDTSRVDISGGLANGLSLAGASAGAAGVRATVSGGVVQNAAGITAAVQNGTLNVAGGTVVANSGQPGISGAGGSVITVSGGLVQSLQGPAIYIAQDSALTMTGGTVTGAAGGGERWGVRLEGVNLMAELRGGTVNGGVRTTAASNQTALQATLSGSLVVNGGVFATGNAAINVTGGSYTRFSGADASFFAMGSNTINFFGTDLALSDPTAGSVFETNNYVGNFYTFTSGTFADGQSAVGLRLFDATSVAGNMLGGGFTLNPSPVPEPSTWLLMALALPGLGALVRRRSGASPAA